MAFDLNKYVERLFMKPIKAYVFRLAILSAFIVFMATYFGQVRISIYSTGLRSLIFFLLLIWALPVLILIRQNFKNQSRHRQVKLKQKLLPTNKQHWTFYGFGIACITFLVLIIALNIFSSPLVQAKAYRNLISVETSNDFTTDIEDYNDMLVPIVDEGYATLIGDKYLGETIGLGSQFHVADFTLIAYNDGLYWIGALEHNTMFTWLSNQGGTPGYISVNATDPSDVELVREHKIKYSPSAFFHQNIKRHLYFNNPTKTVAGRLSFELDDQGVPHYIFSVISKKILATKGANTYGIFTVNASNGNIMYYDIDDIPSWVNHAYPTEEVNAQLDGWGHYVHGFWNSVFAKKEVMQVSEGHNYIYNNGTFYLYTGLTSTGLDESIVGVVLVDLRTKKSIKMYATGGLTEFAAQEAAKGVFQAHRYTATFPLLINYHDEPTYLVLLKDDAGFVKQYAFVNLRDLSKYGTGQALTEAEIDYQRNIALKTGNRLEGAIVSEVSSAVVDNNTVYFIIVKDENGNLIKDAKGNVIIFEASIALSSKLPFVKPGTIISFDYTGSFIQSISVSLTD